MYLFTQYWTQFIDIAYIYQLTTYMPSFQEQVVNRNVMHLCKKNVNNILLVIVKQKSCETVFH